LKRVVGQDIHLFEDGILTASSQRELFQAGLIGPRLPGSIYREMLQENKPARVLSSRLGESRIPVAYAPVRLNDPSRKVVVAVPLLYPQTEIRRAVDRVVELLILTTVALVGLLAIAAAVTARTVARPVRDLVNATNQIAAGRYDTRLVPRTRDELADLVNGFNGMATSLEAQRASLTRRKDYIEALLQNATAGVISTDPQGRIVTINPAARRLLGFTAVNPAEGDLLAEFVGGVPRLLPLSAALSQPPPSAEPQEIDLVDDSGDSEKQRLSLVRVPLPGLQGGSPGILIIMDDVTDMMRSNQLEAWAEMARAIAHEIKNPLTPIQLSTEHMERILRDRGALSSTDLSSCLDTIKKQVRSLREIAAGFSTYAKLPVLQPDTVDPVAFMQDTVAPYRSGVSDGLEIVEDYRPCPPISIDIKVLSRAVVNLIENALQSMSDHAGTLTVRVAPEPAGGSVRFTVGDTGTGLDPEARRRLFDPYFSTKSSGTGLGLAIVKRSVEAHGGSVEVDSSPGEGSRFHILLPLPTTAV
jgi:two-component system nitrogen regulation sensor histidine kinase NtrY